MRKLPESYIIFNWLIASVWIINGLFCKVLGYVPRHEQIVARILGEEYASILIILIGISEILMAIWILSSFSAELNAINQIAIVLLMNVLEFVLAPDLLLWGRFNALFALLFSSFVYWNTFVLRKKVTKQS
jgi:hypothetical protein